MDVLRSGPTRRQPPPGADSRRCGRRSPTATAPLIPSRPLADRDRPWGSWRHGTVDPKAPTEALPALGLHLPRPESRTSRRLRTRASQRLRAPAGQTPSALLLGLLILLGLLALTLLATRLPTLLAAN